MAPSSGQVIASGDQRSSSTVPVISAISEAGDRKDTPAQTPSAPSPPKRTWESRWLSHRSMLCADTSTSSSAKASGRGLASSLPRPSARRWCARHGKDEAPSWAAIERDRRTTWQLASARTSRSGLRQSGIQLAVLRARRGYADVLIGMSASSLNFPRRKFVRLLPPKK